MRLHDLARRASMFFIALSAVFSVQGCMSTVRADGRPSQVPPNDGVTMGRTGFYPNDTPRAYARGFFYQSSVACPLSSCPCISMYRWIVSSSTPTVEQK